ncbi:VOC family protein [Rhizobium deserti]|uniref:VOC family protein n=1 Tax=Rhizobium deserti TaxID=2547961 RepID=A0A4V3APR1_9HYPH|nr:VOC family protein [Rhizobium deserti]TDK38730.1 VOC family protein [Rhizobium deserti]
MSIRLIDHLVLPVSELSGARKRLSALGFTVAPDAFHPFGTSNACIFFGDGSYLEPLAIANRRVAGVAAKRGNVFTTRDIAFRRSRNREGLSALVAASEDAGADHVRFQENGVSAGDMLEFSRAMGLPDGSEAEASFRLAFACDERSADFFLFCCQRIKAFAGDRGELELHSNAVTGLSEIIFSAPAPADFAQLLEMVFEAKADRSETGFRLATGNAGIRVLHEEELADEFALREDPKLTGLTGRAIIFKTADLAVTEITLAANDVAFIRREGRVLVSAAPGQGVLFGFEE